MITAAELQVGLTPLEDELEELDRKFKTTGSGWGLKDEQRYYKVQSLLNDLVKKRAEHDYR
jgi:hypothetical protein